MPTKTAIYEANKSKPLAGDIEIKLIGIPVSWDRGPQQGQGGYQFRQLLEEYQPRTVGAAIRLAKRLENMPPSTVRCHLWWAYAERCLEMNGEAYKDTE